ncbi:hypothetical protein ABIE26_004425 [Pedobacter africanus]|uniref:Uncharacterized protein n=1 Tax=Pedobacter africanus TaxID=151894 RepID=A0ACC6L3W0_9SPHI|nr:hypothetical protein [Pedobacter africanus]MDR6786105.1 hypothetical protein [Pedobacter africanus]
MYKSSEGSFALKPAWLAANDILDKARENFKGEQHKIKGFNTGVAFYIKTHNYPLATLMLHQVMELSYRVAEQIIVGREKISHRIRNHQKFLQPYLPRVNQIFDEHNEGDMQLLDKAYHAVRYEENYRIGCRFNKQSPATTVIGKGIIHNCYTSI